MSYDLVGIGNALVDIEVQVSEDMVNRLDVTKGGMTLSTKENQDQVLAQISSHPQKIVSGGSAANTIHGFSVLGSKAYYLGRVADDSLGKHYTEDMKDCGVGFPGPDSKTDGTGTCLVLVTPDSERTMLTHLGISSDLHPDNVDETIVKEARTVYIEGYLWTGDETRNAALKMADAARQAGVPVAFTLSDAFVVNSYTESLIDFIRWKVDILFCNDVEARTMTGEVKDEQAFAELKGMVDTLFMTRGADGSWAADSQHAKINIDPFQVKAVDTTGAGDLYAAGALYGLIHNYDLKKSAILGSYCAAQVVTHLGGRLPANSNTHIPTILDLYPGA
jgi:sugar/nucleoside kinase (ribokinase family)